MNNKKKAAIVIDSWKLPIFDRHLSQSGYSYKNARGLIKGSLILNVSTENIHALARVISAANEEAALTGEQK